MSKKDTTMNTTAEIKTIADATLELGRRTTHNLGEIGSRALNDMIEYAGAISKAQSSMFGGYSYPTGDLTEGWNKMQSEMFKGYATWIDSVKNLYK